MAPVSVEERLTALETEIARLKNSLKTEKASAEVPWWEQRFGAFADSPAYEEAERLGREYRQSLQAAEDDAAA